MKYANCKNLAKDITYSCVGVSTVRFTDRTEPKPNFRSGPFTEPKFRSGKRFSPQNRTRKLSVFGKTGRFTEPNRFYRKFFFIFIFYFYYPFTQTQKAKTEPNYPIAKTEPKLQKTKTGSPNSFTHLPNPSFPFLPQFFSILKIN
ncbi:hypothetical protein ACJIZ3_009129 [Penstemon smallii]|uniref:Uncharacterized protein n=1 Tax=Penstemon smallii TaxID=265156 RepID=A0ABD3TDX2_9LAMI